MVELRHETVAVDAIETKNRSTIGPLRVRRATIGHSAAIAAGYGYS